MKRITSILSVLFLLVALFAGSVPGARAADWEYTFTGNVDQTENFVITSNPADEIFEARIYSGEIPGMSLNAADKVTLSLTGVPTTAGTYTVYIHMNTHYLGDVDIKVTVIINPAITSGTPKVTKNPTGEEVVEGESATFIARADNVRQYRWQIAIADASMDIQDMPEYLGKNVKVTGYDTEKLVISNIPLELDDAYIWCTFVGVEESVDSKAAVLTVIPEEDATPEVTKDPTDETVDEGGRAVFIAKAKYAQSYQWELLSPQGITFQWDEAVKNFPDLKITGGDAEKIILTDIPAALDGFRLRCKFTAGKEVYSKYATLHVEVEATEPPTEEPTEEVTEAPTEEPSEAPTEAPTEEPTEQTDPPKPTSGKTEAPREEGGGIPITTLLVILIIAIAAVSIAGIVAFTILKLKRVDAE